MHYLHPFTISQLDNLRYQAMNIVASRLGRAEPPLRKEVVEYMLDVDSHMWSMRRSKANFFRIVSLFSGLISMSKWLGEVCQWKNPITTILVHILFCILICYPELILPTAFLYMFLIGIWNFRSRPRHPPHMDTKLSWAEAVHPDELDEEFDTFPTSKPQDIVRMRYDRLRSVAGENTNSWGIWQHKEKDFSHFSAGGPQSNQHFHSFLPFRSRCSVYNSIQDCNSLAGLFFLRHPRFKQDAFSPQQFLPTTAR
ncbi:UNVERIFIED_CONTAM: FT-interacting protein 1 [Sesamum radiatum]|uniref:FT-interacting protein 1 n=1 Tax=Sesamum radiatum TaxID=300843 RepID=A0AAW2LCK4_SESRA